MTNELKSEPKKKEKTDGAKKGPEQVIRDGAIAAMIWRRESTTGFPYYEDGLLAELLQQKRSPTRERNWAGDEVDCRRRRQGPSRTGRGLSTVSLEHNGAPHGRDAAGTPPPSNVEPPPDDDQLADAELQERYRKEYLAQLRRLSCPGCGEDFSVF
jgi:hypothetical protein